MHVIGYTLHGPASITGYMHLPNLSPLFMHVCITSYTCYYQKKKKKHHIHVSWDKSFLIISCLNDLS